MPIDAPPGATDYVLIHNFMIDCSLSENHTFDSDVTMYPVESGGNITDNIRPLPIVVEIEGLVSNSPIGPITNERSKYEIKPSDRAYDLLTAIRDVREPVSITTSLSRYDNMVLKSLSIPKGDHQDALRFQATFQQIQTVENKRSTRVSTPIAQGGSGKDKKKVAAPGIPYDGRIVAVDPARHMWWDADFNVWRVLAEYRPPAPVRNDETGSTTITNTTGMWHLYRGLTFENVKNQPGSVIFLNSNQYVAEGFTWKYPPGTEPPLKGFITGRTNGPVDFTNLTP